MITELNKRPGPTGAVEPVKKNIVFEKPAESVEHFVRLENTVFSASSHIVGRFTT
jgi:hypothetical protein